MLAKRWKKPTACGPLHGAPWRPWAGPHGSIASEHRGADSWGRRARGAELASWPGTLRRVSERLCLLTVHAHPDDEASKGAATVARYHSQGVHTVLVCCTGGEAGEILNPAMDRPEVRQRLHEVRMAELARSAEIIGYDEVVMLGYRDSGMPGTPENADPRSFAEASL